MDSRRILPVRTTVTPGSLDKHSELGAWLGHRKANATPNYIHNAQAIITQSSGISRLLSSDPKMFIITRRATSSAFGKDARSICSKQKARGFWLRDIAGLVSGILKELKEKDFIIRCYVREKDNVDLTEKTIPRYKKGSDNTAPGQKFHIGEFINIQALPPPLQELFKRLFECSPVESDSRVGKLGRSKKAEGERTYMISILLNLLAVLYGSGIAATEIADDASDAIPPSFIYLVRSTLALLVHFPALISALREVDPILIKTGVELGLLSFLSSIIPTFSQNGMCLNDAPLLYALSVVLILIMKACRGQYLTRIKWFSMIVALFGMGVLEEEGSGWKGINLMPQHGGSLWVLASSFISTLKIYRAETLGNNEALGAKSLNAFQTAVLFIMSSFWEMYNVHSTSCKLDGLTLATIAHHLAWLPLIYDSLVCGGLCDWFEISALRGVCASTTTLIYTTIPVWGAFFSTLIRQKPGIDISILGGLVIMLATIWTNKVHSHISDPNSNSQPQKDKSDMTPQPHQLITSSKSISRFNLSRGEDEYKYKSVSAFISMICNADTLPGVMLITQLKSPFYAAQTQRLVSDLDHLLMPTSTNCLANSPSCFKGNPLDFMHITHHAINVACTGPPPYLIDIEHDHYN